jgi:starch synthase (maltosyl-transferring)
VRETMVRLDLSLLGLPHEASFTATDLISGSTYTWTKDTFVRLDSFSEPVHIISVGYGKVTAK